MYLINYQLFCPHIDTQHHFISTTAKHWFTTKHWFTFEWSHDSYWCKKKKKRLCLVVVDVSLFDLYLTFIWPLPLVSQLWLIWTSHSAVTSFCLFLICQSQYFQYYPSKSHKMLFCSRFKGQQWPSDLTLWAADTSTRLHIPEIFMTFFYLWLLFCTLVKPILESFLSSSSSLQVEQTLLADSSQVALQVRSSGPRQQQSFWDLQGLVFQEGRAEDKQVAVSMSEVAAFVQMCTSDELLFSLSAIKRLLNLK